MITQVLNDVVINAMRYTADKLIIKAQRVAERGCSITIEDVVRDTQSLLVLNELSARYLDMEGSRTGLDSISLGLSPRHTSTKDSKDILN